MNKCLWAALFVLIPLTGAARPEPASAETPHVDLMLVLAADISRSVNNEKFKLQREGYAAALMDSRVLSAIQSVPGGRIAVSFIEWSGPFSQSVIVEWTEISGPTDASSFARRLLQSPRHYYERTAIGSAIDFAVRVIEKSPFKASRTIIDVSGDGTSNTGRSVTEARDDALALGIVINGLAILSAVPLATNPLHTHPTGGLLKYYQDNVIGGPGAFAIAAEGHEDFGNAILAKLVKEIALAPLATSPHSLAR